jgi:hypothetical protein
MHHATNYHTLQPQSWAIHQYHKFDGSPLLEPWLLLLSPFHMKAHAHHSGTVTDASCSSRRIISAKLSHRVPYLRLDCQIKHHAAASPREHVRSDNRSVDAGDAHEGTAASTGRKRMLSHADITTTSFLPVARCEHPIATNDVKEAGRQMHLVWS